MTASARLVAAVLAALSSLSASPRWSWGTLKADEAVILFPTDAPRLGAGWNVPIHGWVFEPEADSRLRAGVVRMFREVFDVEEPGGGLFEDRVRPFLYDSERGKPFEVRVGDVVGRIGPSDPGGHFSGTIFVPSVSLPPGIETEADGERWMTARVVLPPSDPREFAGRARLLDERGLSVVSDLDDTIKVSAVTDRKELLANTFLRPFRAVPGMAQLYRAWADRGAAFHYVTASPWQLYVPLEDFLEGWGFPLGTLRMRTIRYTGSGLQELVGASSGVKRPLIEGLLAAFPQRTFVLVGDSGEGDPELYGDLARTYPGVKRVLIRDVTGEGEQAERYREAFRDLSEGLWQIFRDPSELRREEVW